MEDIEYIGDISPCRVRVYSAIFTKWKKGEVRTIDSEAAKKLCENKKNFRRVSSKKMPEPEKQKKEITILTKVDSEKIIEEDDYNGKHRL